MVELAQAWQASVKQAQQIRGAPLGGKNAGSEQAFAALSDLVPTIEQSALPTESTYPQAMVLIRGSPQVLSLQDPAW